LATFPTYGNCFVSPPPFTLQTGPGLFLFFARQEPVPPPLFHSAVGKIFLHCCGFFRSSLIFLRPGPHFRPSLFFSALTSFLGTFLGLYPRPPPPWFFLTFRAFPGGRFLRFLTGKYWFPLPPDASYFPCFFPSSFPSMLNSDLFRRSFFFFFSVSDAPAFPHPTFSLPFFAPRFLASSVGLSFCLRLFSPPLIFCPGIEGLYWSPVSLFRFGNF